MNPELLPRLAKAKVLVAGGAGFVGSQLVRELLSVGAEVVVYDNFLHGTRENLAGLSGPLEVVIGDVLDEFKLFQAFQEHRPRFAFDLVGDTYVPTAYDVPKRFLRVNVEGTMNVLLAAKTTGVERIVYVSSTEVYGEARTTPMTEDHPLAPANTYAVTKLAADRMCYTFHHEHGIPVVIARIYNCYGPRETQPYVIPEIITQLDKGPVVELGNLDARRDFTFVADTARGLMAAALSDIPNGDAVNIGSNRTVSVRELVAEIAPLLGHERYEIRSDPRRLRRLDVECFQCDATKLHRATGWAPTVSLKDGLAITTRWFRENGRAWSWERWVDGTIVYDASV
ncbi:MAG TPA: GDP-mannose 4,6-dehydratase [Polyangiaceae bacterium]|nr:GDP-mannose 4,6-dehydratase [Polyangiaceae bacterium]